MARKYKTTIYWHKTVNGEEIEFTVKATVIPGYSPEPYGWDPGAQTEVELEVTLDGIDVTNDISEEDYDDMVDQVLNSSYPDDDHDY